MYIDSHAHLTSDILVNDIDNILKRAKNVGIDYIINVCTDIKSLEIGLAISKKYLSVFNIAATTPHDVEKEGEKVFPIIEKHAYAGDLIAIGETGVRLSLLHISSRYSKAIF